MPCSAYFLLGIILFHCYNYVHDFNLLIYLSMVLFHNQYTSIFKRSENQYFTFNCLSIKVSEDVVINAHINRTKDKFILVNNKGNEMKSIKIQRQLVLNILCERTLSLIRKKKTSHKY